MENLKPIETVYNGYKFRSRLEARWAVFFDAVGIKYEYEPEGYEVKSMNGKTYRYLPDFYLPKFDLYVEIKPNMEKLYEEAPKIAASIDYHSTPISKGLIILGQIPYYDDDDGSGNGSKKHPVFPIFWWYKGIASGRIIFIANSKCGVEIVFNENYIYDAAQEPQLPSIAFLDKDNLYNITTGIFEERNGFYWDLDDTSKRYSSAILLDGFTKARQARFEHGECG